MLEVVEDDQHRPFAEVIEQLILRREAAVRAVDGELDRLGEGRREEIRRGDGRERDEVHAVRVALDPARGGLERESASSRPARPDEREQAAAWSRAAVDLVRAPTRGPTNDVRGAGRFFMPASIVFSSGKSHGSPSTSSW
jgi:hypothetical protein